MVLALPVQSGGRGWRLADVTKVVALSHGLGCSVRPRAAFKTVTIAYRGAAATLI